MIAALFRQEVSINETACLDNLGLYDCQQANDANTAEIKFPLYIGGLKKKKKVGGEEPLKHLLYELCQIRDELFASLRIESGLCILRELFQPVGLNASLQQSFMWLQTIINRLSIWYNHRILELEGTF